MHWKYSEYRQKARLLLLLAAAVILFLFWPEASLVRGIYGQFCPYAAFCMDTLAYGDRGATPEGKMMDMVSKELPLYSYSISYYGDGMMNEYYKEYVEILRKEAEVEADMEQTDLPEEKDKGSFFNKLFGLGEEDKTDAGTDTASGNNRAPDGKEEENSREAEEGIREEENTENENIKEEGERLNEEDSLFEITDGSKQAINRDAYQELIHTEKKQSISIEEYQEFEKLIEKFYTVDSNTYTRAEELNVEKLSSEDMRISKNGAAPQILIYHTHSQEGYADSVPGDASTSVVGVGEQLAKILREEYGYQVLHHTGTYDVEARDYAYSYALPALEGILAENPSIEVVIDLHRDSVADGNKLVTEIEGVPTAKFMFFNGLSRVRELGEISYLPNENLQKNLAFSFQMEKCCEEYYPGLTRKIYLKGYRYNMHVKPRTLLIELGAQNNTVEEAMNACGPLARVLHLVLSGQG